MKVLFIGEGNHDIGKSEFDRIPQTARGVVPALACRIVPEIDRESIALRWKEITRFNPAAKTGLDRKAAAAVLLAQKFHCDATICVSDQDRKPERLIEIRKGLEKGLRSVNGSTHRVACGLAVESIEAWSLGAPQAIADELSVPLAAVQKLYPKVDVEKLYEKSGKEEHRPKLLLQHLAQLKHRVDNTDFREAIAERTDIAVLEKACPLGFKPFADELRASFTPRT